MVKYFSKDACTTYNRISQQTILAFLKDSDQYEFLSSLNSDQWKVNSFDPKTATICCSVNNGKQITNFTLILPYLIKN